MAIKLPTDTELITSERGSVLKIGAYIGYAIGACLTVFILQQQLITLPIVGPSDFGTLTSDSYWRPPTINCPASQLADHVVVSFKTGATEEERVPPHINTDLYCPPHVVAGADTHEDFDGDFHIDDVLERLSDETKDTEPEFSFYKELNRLLSAGRPLSEAIAPYIGHTDSKEDKPAWKLDKWKFLPLLQLAVERHDNAKWYVFTEADTYMIWSNMLSFLSRYNHEENYYFGAPTWIGDIAFAHGGSGYVLSAPAAHAAAKWVAEHPENVTQIIRENCCGDMIMGIVLQKSGTNLTSVWPTIQGETPQSQDYTDRHWCAPVATFHHMSPKAIGDVWTFEQGFVKSWERRHWDDEGDGRPPPIMHKDVYTGMIAPRLRERLDAWDNLSEREQSLAEPGDEYGESFEACQQLCQRDEKCLQFSWQKGNCRTAGVLRFGDRSKDAGISSGFIVERVNKFTAETLPSCEEPRWPD